MLACKKDNKNDSPQSKKNTVTYSSPFTNTTYTVSEESSQASNNYPNTYVDAGIEYATDYSRFWLDVVGPDLPFTISIRMPRGPLGGGAGPVGLYTSQTQDGGSIEITDKHSDIAQMTISKDTIFITSADKSKIVGNYVFHVAYTNTDKRVAGEFTINSPSTDK